MFWSSPTAGSTGPPRCAVSSRSTASPSSPTARTSRPRSTSAASPSWTCPTTRRRDTGPAGSRPCSTGRRRCTGSEVPGRPGVTAPGRNELGAKVSNRGIRPSAAKAVTGPTVEQAITRAHHEEWARVVADLARRFGDLDVAEEATAEAFDWLRRESQRDAKHQAARIVYDDTPPEPTGPVEDDRLRLVFTCCHPALAMEARVALTLRLLGGLTVPEIARAFLVQETTMARRITRAKAKIKAAHIPYRVPSADDIRERLTGVLAVVYLLFNEGYLAGEGDDPVRVDLTDQAIHLGRLLRTLLPDDGEVAGLLP